MKPLDPYPIIDSQLNAIEARIEGWQRDTRRKYIRAKTRLRLALLITQATKLVSNIRVKRCIEKYRRQAYQVKSVNHLPPA